MSQWNSTIFRGWIEVSYHEYTELKKHGYFVKAKKEQRGSTG
jgi:hypothetical protein